jgi:enoyl-CoA hydratase/carnithine racemase
MPWGSERETVLVERIGHVAHVRLNRPEKRNAIDGAMFAELRAVALEIAATPAVRAVVLSGAGGTFCSGIDIGALASMGSGEVDADTVANTATLERSAQGATPFQQVAWLWHEMPAPVIAAVEGHAVGGGLHIALAADLRVIAPGARVGFAEVGWGLVPDLSGTQSLRRLVRLDVAKRLVLTGELIGGAEAVELGLATLLDDDPVGRALTMAAAIAERSPDAVRAAKRLLDDAALVDVADGLAAEVTAAASLVGTANQVEAAIARFEGRPPVFTDPA